MKKLCISIMAVLIFSGYAHSRDKLIVTAAESIYAKQVTVDGELRLEGPAVKLVTHIFKDFKIPVDTKVIPWKRAMVGLKSGKIDAMITFLYSKERTEFFAFTDDYDSADTSIFVKKGNAFPFKKWDDLIGLKGLRIEGRSEGPEFDTFREENLDITQVTALTNIIKMIALGRYDYAVDKRYDIIMEAKRNGLWEKIEILSMPVKSNKIRIGFSKKSPFVKYVPEVNKKIAALKADGTIEKWIQEVLDTL